MTPQPKKSNNSASEESENFEAEQPAVLSISQLNSLIRENLEGQFANLWIQGEVSNFKAHSSGHWYFSLKDNTSQISAVMFRGLNSKVKFRPEDGMELLVRGRITVYEPRGSYQVFCEALEPLGSGALQKAYEQLKAKLQKEGLFDHERKRELPRFPQHVAIVTSPTGAAIRDMIHVLQRRFAGLRVTLVPALVQGDGAPESIVRAIEQSQHLPEVDVLIVGRGGGSIEDLWAFNSEKVARAIAAYPLPVISAVGHEVDYTIADFVADVRAPTPSAAAEIVVQSSEEVKGQLNHWYHRLCLDMAQRLRWNKGQVQALVKGLVDPRRYLLNQMQKCDDLSERLEAAIKQSLRKQKLRVEAVAGRVISPRQVIKNLRQNCNYLQKYLATCFSTQLKVNRSKLGEMGLLLDSLSPLKVIERGYGILFKDSKVVKSIDQLREKDLVVYQMSNGKVEFETRKLNKN